MSLVLCIHTTYTNVECALARGTHILGSRSIPKEQASSQLISTINILLLDKYLQLSDISHIIVNQGPAPFTTLRTIIATANGMAFAHIIPLVGVDALEAFVSAYSHTYAGPTVVLLNAFNKAVYYGMANASSNTILKGYAPIVSCIEMIQTLFKDSPIQCLGNGAELYRQDIEMALGAQAHFPYPLPLTASIEHILKTGIQLIQNNQGITQHIEPLYLKKPLS